MILVERHYIKGTPEIIRLCKVSKELYNKCNYLMRKAWFGNSQLPDINVLVKTMKSEECYKQLHNTKTAKQTIRKVLNDWSNFKKALKAYYKDKSKFIKCPEPPYYKKKLAQVIFYNETIKGGQSKNITLESITPSNNIFTIKSNKDYKQVIITPKTFGFIIEISYDQPSIKEKTSKEKISCIDIGVNNLCAITSNQHLPLLINGRILKSINQWYNKHPNKKTSKKRYFRIENYFHHVSKLLINNCIKYKIGKIIIGKNNGWKQKIKMKSKNQQNFQYIPFFNLLEKIKYKAELVGIEVNFTEEAYTSQSSFIDRDPLPIYEKGVSHKFSGKRIKRGLYRSLSGKVINADINGSANIGRKVIRNENILLQLDRSLAARPELINPLNHFVNNNKMKIN